MLVVNAGSSTLKLSVVQDDRVVESLTLDRWLGGLDARFETFAAADRPRSTRSAIASCTEATRFHRRRSRSTTRSVAQLHELTPLAPLAPTSGAGRDRCRPARVADRRSRRVLRHRVPRRPCRPPRRRTRSRPSGASAGRCAGSAFTGSRTPTPPGARPSSPGVSAGSVRTVIVPSRCRRVAVRDRSGSVGRHDDGLHAARRARHGDTLREHRSRARAVAPGAGGPRSRRRRRRARASQSVWPGCAEPATCATVLGRRAACRRRRGARVRRLRPRPSPRARRDGRVLYSVDLFVFTGGVGEHAPEVRAAAGVPIDEHANRTTTADGEITASGARRSDVRRHRARRRGDRAPGARATRSALGTRRARRGHHRRARRRVRDAGTTAARDHPKTRRP